MIGELVGKTVREIIKEDDRLVFITICDKRYLMHHDQDCCERVYIEDIVGDLNDLVGSPILDAREDNNINEDPILDGEESYTWTFYNLETIKGSVTIRWYGASNGYYSESVSFNSISRMANWVKTLYKFKSFPEMGLKELHRSIIDDIEGCFIKVDVKKVYNIEDIQELINHIHENKASLV
ncbi:MAG: DUF7448 domain-containing protein [Promethearchaeota archaeon]